MNTLRKSENEVGTGLDNYGQVLALKMSFSSARIKHINSERLFVICMTKFSKHTPPRRNFINSLPDFFFPGPPSRPQWNMHQNVTLGLIF